MSAGMKPLSADLLFLRAPTLMPQAVHLKVKELLPFVEMVPPSASSPAAIFRHRSPSLGVETAFIVSDQPPPPSTYADALLDETSWSGAIDVAKKVRSVITLAELHGEGVEPNRRLEVFTRVLIGCSRALGPDAVFWKVKHRLLAPAFVERLASDRGLVNELV